MKVKKIRLPLLPVLLFVLFGTLSASAIMTTAEEKGVRFDGLAEYKTEAVDMPLPLTYEATVRFPTGFNGNGGVIFGSYSADTASAINLEVCSGGLLRLYIIDGSLVKHDIVFDGVNVYNGLQNHIAITLDREAGAYICYVNGEVAQVVAAAIPEDFTLNSKLVLGGDNVAGNPGYFRGELFGVALYSDVRNSSEISSDATSAAVDTSELIAAYAPLDSGNENSSITAIGDAKYNMTYKCDWIKDVPDPVYKTK